MKLSILIILFLSLTARADQESYYFTIAVGYGSATYSTGLEEKMVSKGSSSFNQIRKDGLAVDMGILFPLTSTWAFGFSGHGYSSSGLGGTVLPAVSVNYYGLGTMYFLGDEIGSGAFARTTIGYGTAETKFVAVSSSLDIFTDKISESGLGGLVGIGYGIPISSGTRILIGTNLSVFNAQSGQYKVLDGVISLMW